MSRVFMPWAYKAMTFWSEPGEAALVLGNELRVKTTVPLARDRQLELAAVG
jgi:hypothetical protein